MKIVTLLGMVLDLKLCVNASVTRTKNKRALQMVSRPVGNASTSTFKGTLKFDDH
jgi:hypothetical protein